MSTNNTRKSQRILLSLQFQHRRLGSSSSAIRNYLFQLIVEVSTGQIQIYSKVAASVVLKSECVSPRQHANAAVVNGSTEGIGVFELFTCRQLCFSRSYHGELTLLLYFTYVYIDRIKVAETSKGKQSNATAYFMIIFTAWRPLYLHSLLHNMVAIHVPSAQSMHRSSRPSLAPHYLDSTLAIDPYQ